MLDNIIKYITTGLKNDHYLLIYKTEELSKSLLTSNLESFYDENSQSYIFPDYELVLKKKIKYDQEIEIKPQDLKIERRGYLIVCREIDGIQFEAQTASLSWFDSINLSIPDKTSTMENYNTLILKREKEKSAKEEKAKQLKKQLEYKKNIAREKALQLEKDLAYKKEILEKSNVTSNDIRLLESFYQRPILENNLLSKFSDFQSITTEEEKDLWIYSHKYKFVFNPTLQTDLYTIQTDEFDLLNKLGMVDQDKEYPYLIKVRDFFDNKNINYINFDNNRVLIIPEQTDILSQVKNGHEFKNFVGDLLKTNDYKNVHIIKEAGNQGVDIISKSVHGIKFVFQTKFYSSTVGSSAVKQIIYGKEFHKAHVAIVVTNNYFTKSAIKLAEKMGVLLWDNNKLQDLIKD